MSERSRRYSPRPRAFAALVMLAAAVAAGSAAGVCALDRAPAVAASH